MQHGQQVVAQAAVEANVEIEAREAFRPAEQLVQRDPEVGLRVAGQGILRPERAPGAAQADRQIGSVASGHDAKLEGLARHCRREGACLGVVERLGRAQARDARAREAQLGVMAANAARCILVLQRIDHDAQRMTCGLAPDVLEAGARDRVDVVLDRLDLRQGRKAGEFHAAAIGDDRGSGERVVEQAAIGGAGLDRPRAGDVEIAKPRIGPVDAVELAGQGGAEITCRDIEFVAGDIQQHLPPAQRRQPAARRRDAIDQRLRVGCQRVMSGCEESTAQGERRVFEKSPPLHPVALAPCHRPRAIAS